MWEKIDTAATVITLLAYVFVESPMIRQRWMGSRSARHMFLMFVVALIGIMALPFVALTFIVQGPIMLASVSATLSLFVLSLLLIMYWVENKTFADRRLSDVAMFSTGTIALSLSLWLVLTAASPSVPGATPVDPGAYNQVLLAVSRLQARTGHIKALKQAGKALGTEHGLLDPNPGNSLSPTERDLLQQENQDRRELFEFIAKYSAPPVSYERVANEYAKNIWKEWPPRMAAPR